ncbi:MFS transporter [Rurimicrobium arvi]|uniref:MFS transporter n=1 Tax=Rurimicrobium arvi TaxID=2049916 RepID=A0ABP8N2Z0_9BACT
MSNTKGLWKIIGASSVGTLIEWYDFYIFGSLATIISTKFFPSDNPTAAFLATLATFAAGFVVRPFGALFFGRLGDLIGRKYTFMVTLLLMGGATFAIGCIPSYESIGFFAPLLVLLLRLLQGLALGGEYGGAATYVAEHAPANRRGYWTSWIQTTATVGLFVSLLVIMITRLSISKEAFNEWGWRVPFWVSILMVLVSYIIRKNMHESPLFAKVKAEGKTAANPLKESFGNKLNFKFVLLALFGATMGQGVVWYTGQFYAMSFIEKICSVDKMQSDTLMAIALLMGTPFFLVFGGLSDRIGRKKIMLAGMLIAVFAYRPIYEKMYQTVNLKNKTEVVDQTTVSGVLKENAKTSGFDSVVTTDKYYTDGTHLNEVKTTTLENGVAKIVDGKPKVDTKKTITINDGDKWTLVFLVFIQVLLVTMVYGPIAAFLVELFPTKIRYTSMSLPYHIGNGVFGGLLPAVATYLASKAKDANTVAEKANEALPYAQPYLEGLWYPIIVSAICFVIGLVYINSKIKHIED